MNLLDEYSLELEELKNNQNILSIIIFGSYSENKVKPLSDLDICILTKPNLSRDEKRDILSYSDEKLDISLFEELPLSLQYKILTKGTIFMSKINLNNLKNKITNNWFDFRVNLNRLYKKRGFKGLEI